MLAIWLSFNVLNIVVAMVNMVKLFATSVNP